MSGQRPNIQEYLASQTGNRGEASGTCRGGTEPLVARREPQSPALEERLMEDVCERDNLERAWQRVRENKGSPGIDGLTIDAAVGYLREHWPTLRERLLQGTYQPQPVKRVEIPKPEGGVRKLGIPCVVDRLIQQALLQVLQKRGFQYRLLSRVGIQLVGLQGLVQLPKLSANRLDDGPMLVVVRHHLDQGTFRVNPTSGVQQDDEL